MRRVCFFSLFVIAWLTLRTATIGTMKDSHWDSRHIQPHVSLLFYLYTLYQHIFTDRLVSATTITITTTITLRNIGDDDGHTRKSDFNYIYIRGQTTVHRRLGPTLWTVLVVPD